MDKHNKKDLEELLIKQTEKIFTEIDPAAAIMLAKNVKSHCKDLTRKFLKTQKKIKKQMELINSFEKNNLANKVIKAAIANNAEKEPLKRKVLPVKRVKEVSKKTIAKPANKVISKRVRKGNNLTNSASIQGKVKASLVKNINKVAKK